MQGTRRRETEYTRLAFKVNISIEIFYLQQFTQIQYSLPSMLSYFP